MATFVKKTVTSVPVSKTRVVNRNVSQLYGSGFTASEYEFGTLTVGDNVLYIIEGGITVVKYPTIGINVSDIVSGTLYRWDYSNAITDFTVSV